MLLNIFSHTPPWVWLLLATLVALGLAQRRERRVRPAQLLILPLALLALGLFNLAPVFLALPLVALAWLVALVAASLLGRRWLKPVATARWLADEARLLLPGSWLPLVLIVSIFSLRYTSAVLQSLNPAWQRLLALQLPLALLFGALSGLLLGRALALRALAPRAENHS